MRMIGPEIGHLVLPRRVIVSLHDVGIKLAHLFEFQELLKLAKAIQKSDKKGESQEKHCKSGAGEFPIYLYAAIGSKIHQ